MTKLRFFASIFTLLLLMVVAPSSAQTLKTFAGAGTFSIDLPEEWTPVGIPGRVICQASERNAMGQPVVMVNVGPDTSELAFAELREKQRQNAEGKSREGDVHEFEDVELEAGTAFSYTRITTTNSGKRQLVRNTFVEAGQGVWMIGWVVPAGDDPHQHDELWAAVVESFQVH